MKVLVLSDSHGFGENVMQAVSDNSDCKTVFFLGDGARDIEKCKEEIPGRQYIIVKGNNDFMSVYDLTAYKYIEGCTVVAAHGHTYAVKRSLLDLTSHAQSVCANAVFYGHTHKRDFHIDQRTGLFVLNPGALCLGQYAVAYVGKNGVDAEFKSLK